MESKQIIKDYFVYGFKYEDMVQILRKRHSIIITERHLKRISKSEHCFKRIMKKTPSSHRRCACRNLAVPKFLPIPLSVNNVSVLIYCMTYHFHWQYKIHGYYAAFSALFDAMICQPIQ